MIAQLCGNSHKNWDKYLPEITFALNTATRETTGQSAAQIIFGRNPVPPNQVRNEGPTPDEPQIPLNMPKLWEQVQTAAQKASQTQQKYFNKNRRQWQPKIGYQVYKREHPLSSATRNFAQKLAPKYSGPYRISKYNTTNIVEVIDPNTNTTHRCHVKDLKTFHSIVDMEHKCTQPLDPGQLRKFLARQIMGAPTKPEAYRRPAEATPRPRPLAAPVLAEQRRIAIQENIAKAREAMKRRTAENKGQWKRANREERARLHCVNNVDILITEQISPTITPPTTTITHLPTTTVTTPTPPPTTIIPVTTTTAATVPASTSTGAPNIPRKKDPFDGITIRKNKRGRKWTIRRPGRDISVTVISEIHAELRYANLVKLV